MACGRASSKPVVLRHAECHLLFMSMSQRHDRLRRTCVAFCCCHRAAVRKVVAPDCCLLAQPRRLKERAQGPEGKSAPADTFRIAASIRLVGALRPSSSFFEFLQAYPTPGPNLNFRRPYAHTVLLRMHADRPRAQNTHYTRA